MERKTMTIKLELTEAEAAALDRYVEEGCYDRDKLIKRLIVNLVADLDSSLNGQTTDSRHWRQIRLDNSHPANSKLASDPAIFS